MITIETKFYGPTNTRGSKIIASTCNGHRLSISYPYELSGEACHRKAAQALADKMGWAGRLIAGGTKAGYAFVFVE